MNVSNVSSSRESLRGAQEGMFGILRIMFGGIEVDSSNDGCNGHIIIIWCKRNWFITLSSMWLRILE